MWWRPHNTYQSQFDDFVNDLELPKNKSVVLFSKFRHWNLLQLKVTVPVYRQREFFCRILFKNDDFVLYTDIDGLRCYFSHHSNSEWHNCDLFKNMVFKENICIWKRMTFSVIAVSKINKALALRSSDCVFWNFLPNNFYCLLLSLSTIWSSSVALWICGWTHIEK